MLPTVPVSMFTMNIDGTLTKSVGYLEHWHPSYMVKQASLSGGSRNVVAGKVIGLKVVNLK
jgi:hypothetical protein